MSLYVSVYVSQLQWTKSSSAHFANVVTAGSQAKHHWGEGSPITPAPTPCSERGEMLHKTVPYLSAILSFPVVSFVCWGHEV